MLVSTLFSVAALVLPLVTARPPPGSDCPDSVGRQGLTRRFYYVLFEQPDRNYTQDALDFFNVNLTVTDTTANYPGPKKGQTLPKRGTYARSRRQFMNEISVHFPWPYHGILGGLQGGPSGGQDPPPPYAGSGPGYVDLDLTNAVGNINSPCYVDNAMDITAKLLVNYGGKKKGDIVHLSVSGHMDINDLDPDPSSQDYRIYNVNYSIDWTNWYASLN